MLHFFYSLFFRIALPFVLLRLWWIGRTNPEAFVRWQERLGYVEAFDEPVIWFMPYRWVKPLPQPPGESLAEA